jgi:hypothetical protein
MVIVNYALLAAAVVALTAAVSFVVLDLIVTVAFARRAVGPK